MKSFYLLFLLAITQPCFAGDKIVNSQCDGIWTVTGDNRRALDGKNVEDNLATTISIPNKTGETGSYVRPKGNSYELYFKMEGFPIDLRRFDNTLLPHTINCENNRLTLIWVSKRTGEEKMVSFDKKES